MDIIDIYAIVTLLVALLCVWNTYKLYKGGYL